jgi:hypothetical protein
MLDPSLANDRTLIVDPREKKSNTDKLDPSVAKPYIDIELDKREKDLTLMALPKLT